MKKKAATPPEEALRKLLHKLERYHPTKQLIAEAPGVKYVTVAHWYDGRSYPSFDITMRILEDLEQRASKEED